MKHLTTPRSALLLCALVFSAFVITACSGDSQPEKGDASISFWHFWSEPYQKEALKEIIADFEKENACTVEVVDLSWSSGKGKLFVAFNSNTAPDVLELGSDWVAQFSEQGVLTDISAEIPLDRFDEFAIAPALYKGVTYGVPWIVDTRVLYYNKKLLKDIVGSDAPATNYQQLLAHCEAVQSSGKASGWGANGPDEHRLYKKALSFVWSNGGDLFGADGQPTLNSPEGIKALEQYVALARAGAIETQRQLDVLFQQGKIAYLMSGSWLISKLDTATFGAVVMPELSAGKPGIAFAGGEYLAISAQSKKKELAKKFIEFMTKGENALRFSKKINEAGFPADRNFFNNEYFATIAFRNTYIAQLPNSKMTPVHPQWLDIEKLLEQAYSEALYGKMTPAEALNQAQAKALELTRAI